MAASWRRTKVVGLAAPAAFWKAGALVRASTVPVPAPLPPRSVMLLPEIVLPAAKLSPPVPSAPAWSRTVPPVTLPVTTRLPLATTLAVPPTPALTAPTFRSFCSLR